MRVRDLRSRTRHDHLRQGVIGGDAADLGIAVNEKIYQAMLAESRKLGNFAHGYAYWAHPVAAAVALEV